MSKNTKTSSTPSTSRHEDDAHFRRAGSDHERRRETSAGSENPDTSGTHSDERYARERYGEQSAEQRRESMRQEQPENLGGQDSRDQSPKDQHSLVGGRKGSSGGREEETERRQRESAGKESHASETRESLSRTYAESQLRDYDGNWTKDTDKPSQPGPASGGAGGR